MTVTYTDKNILEKNISASYSIWNTDIGNDLLNYTKAISVSNYSHLMLIILPSKPDFSLIDKILRVKKIKNHGFITLQYQTLGTGELKPIAQVALLVSNSLTLEPRNTSWFRDDFGLASNVWDLTPNNSLSRCSENLKQVSFGHISFDVLILMQQLASPLSFKRFNYFGVPSKSVLKYGKEVLDCNIVCNNI